MKEKGSPQRNPKGWVTRTCVTQERRRSAAQKWTHEMAEMEEEQAAQSGELVTAEMQARFHEFMEGLMEREGTSSTPSDCRRLRATG